MYKDRSTREDFRQKLGARGEQAAAEFLISKGYEIIERNWRLSFGELDIIAKHDSELVFVEVKSRIGSNSNEAERYLFDTITFKKQQKLRQMAQIYLDRRFGDRQRRLPIRIDIIGVIIEPKGLKPIKLKHLTDAV